ncbi:MAG TPA: acyl-CoA dehydrogenase family protein, partial [Anaerolineales bacterium]
MTQGLISLTEEHEMIHQAARDLAQKEITPIAAEFDGTGEVPIVQPQALRQRVNDLEQRVASLEADLGRTGESRPAAALNWRLIIFFAATVVLAVIPPLLVI